MYENNKFLIFHTSISTRNKVIKKKKELRIVGHLRISDMPKGM